MTLMIKYQSIPGCSGSNLNEIIKYLGAHSHTIAHADFLFNDPSTFVNIILDDNISISFCH